MTAFNIEPFTANHQVYRSDGNGGLSAHWQTCRAIGVTIEDGEPAYIVEVFENGVSRLEIAETLKRPAPTA